MNSFELYINTLDQKFGNGTINLYDSKKRKNIGNFEMKRIFAICNIIFCLFNYFFFTKLYFFKRKFEEESKDIYESEKFINIIDDKKENIKDKNDNKNEILKPFVGKEDNTNICSIVYEENENSKNSYLKPFNNDKKDEKINKTYSLNENLTPPPSLRGLNQNNDITPNPKI